MMLETETTNFEWFAVFVALNTLILLILGMNISRLRMTQKIPYGDGGYRPLMQAIRAHGNGVEHTTIFALVVLALTFLDMATLGLAGLVLVFTFARLLHAYGMLYKNFNARRLGAALTFFLQGIAVLIILVSL